MKWTLLIYIVLGLGILIFFLLQHPILGKLPSGDRLKRIKQSPHYRNGQFQNLNPTPQLTNGATMPGMIYDMVFGKKPENLRPPAEIPHTETNLHTLHDGDLVWFGHSSYILKKSGKIFLVDPVLTVSGPSLLDFLTPYKGSNTYHVTDLPEIDYLIITHDHYDHLDYRAIKALIPSVGHTICGLGVGAHLERWGADSGKITELDWWESHTLGENLTITATPARHFSGRSLSRNQTLWCSYVLDTGNFRLFIGGDSGYDTHFKTIGEQWGPFDLAILENGQYNLHWKHIHTLPEELPKVIQDLNTKTVLPVHFGKFELARHAWDEPPILAKKYNNGRLLTPRIGEIVRLQDTTQVFSPWWETVRP